MSNRLLGILLAVTTVANAASCGVHAWQTRNHMPCEPIQVYGWNIR